MTEPATILRERTRYPISGGLMLLIGLGLLLAAPIALGVKAFTEAEAARLAGHIGKPPDWRLLVGAVAAFVAGIFVIKGLFVQGPNEARVLQFFGRYIGTVRTEGLRWTNPLNAKARISLRVHNFETAKIKVNDVEGNPIEIAAIVVWRVVDTAQASFAVENYASFVHVQAESAVRNLATRYPYDAHEQSELSLRSSGDDERAERT